MTTEGTEGSATTPRPRQAPKEVKGASEDSGDAKEREHPLTPRWSIIVPAVIVAAAILLVGLPLGALGIVHYSGCCFADGPEDVVTFWATLTAGFLALFGMVITSVFIITAFRIDTTAKMEARLQADRALDTYLKRYKKKLFDQLGGLVGEIEIRRDKANETMERLEQEVKRHRDAANKAIGELQNEVTEEAASAKQSIESLLTGVADHAGAARRSIAEVRNDTERARDEAVEAIDSAVESVETAARDARTRIEQAGRQPPPEGDEGDPNA